MDDGISDLTKARLEPLDVMAQRILNICASRQWRETTRTLRRDIRIRQDELAPEPPDSVPEKVRAKWRTKHHGEVLLIALREKVLPTMTPKSPLLRQYTLTKKLLFGLDAVAEAEIGDRPRQPPNEVRRWLHYRAVDALLPVDVLYVFTLMLTARRLERHGFTGGLLRVDRVLWKFHTLNILEYYRNGVADTIVDYNGKRLFASWSGAPFVNRYHYYHAVREGETLREHVQRRYRFIDLNAEDIMTALLRENEALVGLRATSPLPPPIVEKGLWITPPKSQQELYADQARDRARQLGEQQAEDWLDLIEELRQRGGMELGGEESKEFGELLADLTQVRSAARECQVEPSTIRGAVKAGRLGAFKIAGGKFLVRLSEGRRLWPVGGKRRGRKPGNKTLRNDQQLHS